jgi:3-methyladenine DNA glycosylase AlkD
MLEQLDKRLKELENLKKAKILQGFFKTGKGEYGEGDIFLGLVMGQNRLLAKEFKDLDLDKIQKLLETNIHEKRMIAVLILVDKFNTAKKKEDKNVMKAVYNFYLKNAKRINNWDLVDLSAPHIVGGFLLEKDKAILYDLVKSDNLWERRISILGPFAFIRANDFEDALKISELLLEDKHDLIHKAVGWMLREIGKKDVEVLKEFLKKHYQNMPRTMLRYSIEKFPEDTRKKYLRGEI